MIDYTNFKYFKGESECPFGDNERGMSFWWRIEMYAFNRKDKKEKNKLSRTMIHYLKELMWEGDGQHDTTEEEMIERAEDLYKRGIWSRNYISFKRYSLEHIG